MNEIMKQISHRIELMVEKKSRNLPTTNDLQNIDRYVTEWS